MWVSILLPIRWSSRTINWSRCRGTAVYRGVPLKKVLKRACGGVLPSCQHLEFIGADTYFKWVHTLTFIRSWPGFPGRIMCSTTLSLFHGARSVRTRRSSSPGKWMANLCPKFTVLLCASSSLGTSEHEAASGYIRLMRSRSQAWAQYKPKNTFTSLLRCVVVKNIKLGTLYFASFNRSASRTRSSPTGSPSSKCLFSEYFHDCLWHYIRQFCFLAQERYNIPRRQRSHYTHRENYYEGMGVQRRRKLGRKGGGVSWWVSSESDLWLQFWLTREFLYKVDTYGTPLLRKIWRRR